MSIAAPLALHHAAWLVRDLEGTALALKTSLGVGPWHVWTIRPERCRVRGREQPFSFRVALALPHDGGTGGTFELVSPLSGPSVCDEFLDERGPGFHHACVTYASIDALRSAKAALLAEGRTAIQEASSGDSFEFVYFDFPELGSAIEILYLDPATLGPPEATL